MAYRISLVNHGGLTIRDLRWAVCKILGNKNAAVGGEQGSHEQAAEGAPMADA